MAVLTGDKRFVIEFLESLLIKLINVKATLRTLKLHLNNIYDLIPYIFKSLRRPGHWASKMGRFVRLFHLKLLYTGFQMYLKASCSILSSTYVTYQSPWSSDKGRLLLYKLLWLSPCFIEICCCFNAHLFALKGCLLYLCLFCWIYQVLPGFAEACSCWSVHIIDTCLSVV